MIESTGSMGRTATYAEELLVAEVTRLRGELSLAEEGLANCARKNDRLEIELLEINKALGLSPYTRSNSERVRVALRLRLLLRQWQLDVGGAGERLERETLGAINGVPQT